MFGDSFYKHEYDRVVNENKLLKQKVEKLEKDKLELKRSLFDLNGRLNRAVQIAGRIVPYDIDGNASSDLPPDASGSGSRVETDIGPTVRVHKNAAVSGGGASGTEARGFSCVSTIPLPGGAVYSVRFSRGGQLAAGSFDGSIHVWGDANRQESFVCLEDHELSVSGMAWSRDCGSLLSGSFDGTVRLWDIQAQTCTQILEAGGLVQAVALCGLEQCVVFSDSANRLTVQDVRASPSSPAIVHSVSRPIFAM